MNQDITRSEKVLLAPHLHCFVIITLVPIMLQQQQKDYRKTAAALETANRTGKPVSQYQGRINNYKFSIKGIRTLFHSPPFFFIYCIYVCFFSLAGYDVGHKIALCLGGSNNQSNLRNELASDNRARGAKEAQLARDRRESIYKTII